MGLCGGQSDTHVSGFPLFSGSGFPVGPGFAALQSREHAALSKDHDHTRRWEQVRCRTRVSE